jgi:hypothetical protein
MVIDAVNLELHRSGDTAKLVLRARPFSHEVKITFEELEQFTLYLADQVGQWRNDRIRTEGGTLN